MLTHEQFNVLFLLCMKDPALNAREVQASVQAERDVHVGKLGGIQGRAQAWMFLL